MSSCIRKNKTLMSLSFIMILSSYGIWACILHKLQDGTRKAIAHASRSSLPAKKQYSQIEKEALGIIFLLWLSSTDTSMADSLHYRRITNHCCRFLVKRKVYRYTPPTDFNIGVPYYWTTISKLSTCLLNISVMPTDYPDLFRSIRGFNYRNVKNCEIWSRKL